MGASADETFGGSLSSRSEPGAETPGRARTASTMSLWEQARSLKHELALERELRRGRSAALASQDEALRTLRAELIEGRQSLQAALEARQCAQGRLQGAERGLDSLQEANAELQQLWQRCEAEQRKLEAAAAKAAKAAREAAAAEAARSAAFPSSSAASWARDGPETEALKAAKLELAEILAESDEVHLRSRRDTAHLQRQLDSAQAENIRQGGSGVCASPDAAGGLPSYSSAAATPGPGRLRSVWRLLTTARSSEDQAEGFA